MPFDIRQLRYALTAADHGSFYRAARVLGVEQSTLSRNISKLEHAVGASLFLRSRAGVTPTIAGAQFLPEARHILAVADRSVAAMRAAGQGRAGELAIGYYGPISAGNLRATLLEWRGSNPGVVLDGVEANRDMLLGRLNTGAIDVAIMLGGASYEDVCRAALWSEPVLAGLPVNHELADRDHLHWADLNGETILLTRTDPGPEIRDMLRERLWALGSHPAIKLYDISRETIMSILGGGSAVTITCGAASGAQYPDVVLREIHEAHGQALIGYSGYWRKENTNPVLRRFLTFLRNRYALSFDI